MWSLYSLLQASALLHPVFSNRHPPRVPRWAGTAEGRKRRSAAPPGQVQQPLPGCRLGTEALLQGPGVWLPPDPAGGKNCALHFWKLATDSFRFLSLLLLEYHQMGLFVIGNKKHRKKCNKSILVKLSWACLLILSLSLSVYPGVVLLCGLAGGTARAGCPQRCAAGRMCSRHPRWLLHSAFLRSPGLEEVCLSHCAAGRHDGLTVELF